MSWASDLKKLCDQGGHDLQELMKAVKIELFTGIVSDTRVDTGRLRGNWQIQENSPASGTVERLDPTGSQVIAEVTEKASGDGKTYFVNNLPYAIVYEEMDGMVARNVTRAKWNLRRMAREIRK